MKTHVSTLLLFVILGVPGLTQERSAGTIAVVNGVETRSFDNARAGAVAAFVAEHGREPDGQADERVISAQVIRRKCEVLRSEVHRVLEEQEKQRLGIKASPEDIEVARKRVQSGTDPVRVAAQSQVLAKAILEALTDVHERADDPEQVYQRRFADRQVSEAAWQAILQQSKTSDWRSMYTLMTQRTAEDVARGLADMDVRPIAERRLFDAAIDDEIASRDSNFKEYLADERRQREEVELKGGSISMLSSRFEYLQQKRKEHWDDVHARASVVIMDSEVADSCVVYGRGR